MIQMQGFNLILNLDNHLKWKDIKFISQKFNFPNHKITIINLQSKVNLKI